MSLEKLEALEGRVRRLVSLVQELTQANESLREELALCRERLAKQEEMVSSWEEERADIRTRIESVIGELDFLECSERVAGGAQ